MVDKQFFPKLFGGFWVFSACFGANGSGSWKSSTNFFWPARNCLTKIVKSHKKHFSSSNFFPGGNNHQPIFLWLRRNHQPIFTRKINRQPIFHVKLLTIVYQPNSFFERNTQHCTIHAHITTHHTFSTLFWRLLISRHSFESLFWRNHVTLLNTNLGVLITTGKVF